VLAMDSRCVVRVEKDIVKAFIEAMDIATNTWHWTSEQLTLPLEPDSTLAGRKLSPQLTLLIFTVSQ